MKQIPNIFLCITELLTLLEKQAHYQFYQNPPLGSKMTQKCQAKHQNCHFGELKKEPKRTEKNVKELKLSKVMFEKQKTKLEKIH